MPYRLARTTQTVVTDTVSAAVDLATSVAETVVDIDALVRSHLPLVGHLVREVLSRVPSHVTRDDLVSAGMYALAAAAKAFDPAQGVAFGAYAAIRVRGALADELRSRDWASRSVRTKSRELERVRCELATTLNRVPSRDELAASLGITAEDVAAIEADVARAATVSLQALAPEDSDSLVPSTGEQPESLIVRREQIGLLHDAVVELPERMRTVVLGYFFDQRKMADIAEELGVTESRVSQLRSEALVMLREVIADREEAAVATPPTDLTARARSRAAAKAAYAAAVATRSTVADRLAASTTFGEPLDPRTRAAGPALGTPVAPHRALRVAAR